MNGNKIKQQLSNVILVKPLVNIVYSYITYDDNIISQLHNEMIETHNLFLVSKLFEQLTKEKNMLDNDIYNSDYQIYRTLDTLRTFMTFDEICSNLNISIWGIDKVENNYLHEIRLLLIGVDSFWYKIKDYCRNNNELKNFLEKKFQFYNKILNMDNLDDLLIPLTWSLWDVLQRYITLIFPKFGYQITLHQNSNQYRTFGNGMETYNNCLGLMIFILFECNLVHNIESFSGFPGR
jgi:hypothetical protein